MKIFITPTLRTGLRFTACSLLFCIIAHNTRSHAATPLMQALVLQLLGANGALPKKSEAELRQIYTACAERDENTCNEQPASLPCEWNRETGKCTLKRATIERDHWERALFGVKLSLESAIPLVVAYSRPAIAYPITAAYSAWAISSSPALRFDRIEEALFKMLFGVVGITPLLLRFLPKKVAYGLGITIVGTVTSFVSLPHIRAYFDLRSLLNEIDA